MTYADATFYARAAGRAAGRAFVEGLNAAAGIVMFALGFGCAAAAVIAAALFLVSGLGGLPKGEKIAEGERVAECRAMPGYPRWDANMRFAGCDAADNKPADDAEGDDGRGE